METIIKEFLAAAALLALGHMLRDATSYVTMQARVDATMKTEAIHAFLDEVGA